MTSLSTTYFIKESYQTTGRKDEPSLLVPIDRSISDKYSSTDKETLYSRSLHFVFNSYVESKVKWYAQEWFRIVLIIVAIVITVMGDYSGSILGAAIAAGTATLEMVLVAVLIMAIKYIVFTVVTKLFLKVLGPKYAMIVAVIAAVVALNYGALSGPQGAPWAKDLLTVSNGLLKETGTYYTEALKGIAEEADQFAIFAKGEMEKLETAKKLLENDNYLTPFIVFGESPTEYYNRTVHAGNIGMVGIDAIHSYVDTSLRLPSFSDTVGHTFT